MTFSRSHSWLVCHQLSTIMGKKNEKNHGITGVEKNLRSPLSSIRAIFTHDLDQVDPTE